MISLVVEAEDDEADLLGKYAYELQDGVTVNDTSISGTLKYVTGYTGFSGDPDEQEGNFIALKFTAPEGSTTTVEIIGGTSGPVELDEDMNWVGRIRSNDQQIEVTTTTVDEDTITKVYSLTNLVLTPQA